jgi:hypothetical protein
MGELLAALLAFGFKGPAEQDLLGIVDDRGTDQGSGEEADLDFSELQPAGGCTVRQ